MSPGASAVPCPGANVFPAASTVLLLEQFSIHQPTRLAISLTCSRETEGSSSTITLRCARPIEVTLSVIGATRTPPRNAISSLAGLTSRSAPRSHFWVACGLLRLLIRSEEHTSELQSRRDLVCRLLLEKKKKT